MLNLFTRRRLFLTCIATGSLGTENRILNTNNQPHFLNMFNKCKTRENNKHWGNHKYEVSPAIRQSLTND
jgi:hypothetical protein